MSAESGATGASGTAGITGATDSRIGIDLGGTKIEGIVLDGGGLVGDRIRINTPGDDYSGTVRALSAMVRRLDASGRMKVGIGTPGAWVEARQCMQNCNSTWLNGRPLLHDLIAELGPRVRLANDADCFALSEARSGSAAGFSVVFGVILGTGVGGGLVVDGKLLHGPNGLTGEWGHTRAAALDSAARSFPVRHCYCGQADCVETFLSGPGLLATHAALFKDEASTPPTARQLYLRAALDDSKPDVLTGLRARSIRVAGSDVRHALDPVDRARATLGVYCQMLARNLAQVVNIVDPDAIVLGGGLSQMAEIYAPVREFMAEYVFGEVFETHVLPPRFGDASGVRGAAWLWD